MVRVMASSFRVLGPRKAWGFSGRGVPGGNAKSLKCKALGGFLHRFAIKKRIVRLCLP